MGFTFFVGKLYEPFLQSICHPEGMEANVYLLDHFRYSYLVYPIPLHVDYRTTQYITGIGFIIIAGKNSALHHQLCKYSDDL